MTVRNEWRLWCFGVGAVLQVAVTGYEFCVYSISGKSPRVIMFLWCTALAVSIVLLFLGRKYPRLQRVAQIIVVVVCVKSTFFGAFGIQLSFNEREWKNNVGARRRMVFDLVRSRFNEASNRAKIQSILGPPDQVDTIRYESIMEFYLIDKLGHRDVEPADGETLVVFYDLSLRIQKCVVFGRVYDFR